jgi:DNA-binding GntR family transcriptional regulator
MTTTLKERAYTYIRDRLLLGEIPTGKRLSDAEIARELGISRTPVREAIVHLEAQGLVEQQPGAGPTVKVLNRREMEETFELREVLECGSAVFAASRITDAEIAGLEQLLDQYEAAVSRLEAAGVTRSSSPWSDQLNLLDMAFHLKIIEAARNRQLLRMVRDLQLLTRIMQRRAEIPTMTYPERLKEICAQHRAIAGALRQRDVELVRQNVRRHVVWGRDCHLQAFDWEQRQKAESAGAVLDMYHPQHVLDMLRKMEANLTSTEDKP